MIAVAITLLVAYAVCLWIVFNIYLPKHVWRTNLEEPLRVQASSPYRSTTIVPQPYRPVEFVKCKLCHTDELPALDAASGYVCVVLLAWKDCLI